MYVHSLLPVLGLSLISTTTAHPSISSSHAHPKRDLMVPQPGYSAWNYAGCYTDTPSSRGLSLDYFADENMTEGKCIAYCDQKGYSRAAVEYWRECFCGYEVQSPSTPTDESKCNFACPGAPDQPCGGAGAMNVFTNNVAPPSENPGPDGWTSLGCYTDSGARTLNTFKPSGDGIVFVYSCTNTCAQGGFKYAGVENGNECFCGNEILNGGAPAAAETCNKPCTGNRGELCGGPWRLNLYQAL